MWNDDWKKGEDYPVWGNTDVYKKTISGGYLLQDETPRDAYMRVAKTVAGYAWLALYYPTQVLIAVYLSVVLALMLRIRFKI